MPYFDTSVLAAYYCPERLSAAAQAEILGAREVVISPLTEVEFHSAVARKTRAGELEAAVARQLLSAFRGHCAEAKYRIVPLGAGEYALACEWLGRFSTALRALDALHLAACSTRDLEMVTADAALARCAKRLGVRHTLLA